MRNSKYRLSYAPNMKTKIKAQKSDTVLDDFFFVMPSPPPVTPLLSSLGNAGRRATDHYLVIVPTLFRSVPVTTSTHFYETCPSRGRPPACTARGAAWARPKQFYDDRIIVFRSGRYRAIRLRAIPRRRLEIRLRSGGGPLRHVFPSRRVVTTSGEMCFFHSCVQAHTHAGVTANAHRRTSKNDRTEISAWVSNGPKNASGRTLTVSFSNFGFRARSESYRAIKVQWRFRTPTLYFRVSVPTDFFERFCGCADLSRQVHVWEFSNFFGNTSIPPTRPRFRQNRSRRYFK